MAVNLIRFTGLDIRGRIPTAKLASSSRLFTDHAI